MRGDLDRLSRSRSLMQRVKDAGAKRFDMVGFFGCIAGTASRIPAELASRDPNECGTSACWCGWLQLHFAEGWGRELSPRVFGKNFLDIDDNLASQLFLSANIYNKGIITQVTIDDVLAVHDRLHARWSKPAGKDELLHLADVVEWNDAGALWVELRWLDLQILRALVWPRPNRDSEFAFTSSRDRAFELKDKLLPDWGYQVRHSTANQGQHGVEVELYPPRMTDDTVTATAPTLPIALTVAVLRAKASET